MNKRQQAAFAQWAKEATDQRIEQGEDGPVRQTIGYREGATGRFVHLGEGETSKAGVELSLIHI